jgi:hypothetical protein
VRIIIVGATAVAALTFCRASAVGFVAEEVSSTGAPLKSAAPEAPEAPPTIPNALGAAATRLDVAFALVAGDETARPGAWEDASNRELNAPPVSAEGESSVHPARAQTTTSKAVAFISDSVEVSLETSAEPAVAH